MLVPGFLCSGDLFAINTLLNGEICSSGVIDCLSGTEENFPKNEIAVYPNPADEYIYLDNISNREGIYLSDVSGKQWNVSVTNHGNNSIKLYIGNLPYGSYFLRTTKGGRSGYIKIIRLKT
jgi:hypothetical protein